VTTSVTVKPVSLRFYTEHITAVLWPLTCAAGFKTVTFLSVNHTG